MQSPESMTNHFLNIKNLCVRYNNQSNATNAVSEVTLNLEAGQIGVLIGPSGCGKTTLLRAIAGLESVQKGRILVKNQCMAGDGIFVPPQQRQIGMVFQDYALFPHLTIAKNIAFGLHDLPKTQQQNQVQKLLELVNLAGYAQKYPHELSGGQQQRVALARALAPQPKLLLLDEPFSSLDVDLRERLATELRGILKAANATALFVTHDQMEAFAIGDVIGVMHNGQLHQWDDAYTLYHRPATRFVANFIGHAVFLPAQRLLGRDEVAFQTPLGVLIDTDPINPHVSSTHCDVLLRADDIIHDDQASVQAKIIRKSFRGSEFLYTLELITGEVVLAHVPSHHNHAIGEWIGIRAEVDHVVTFPSVSVSTTMDSA